MNLINSPRQAIRTDSKNDRLIFKTKDIKKMVKVHNKKDILLKT